MSLVLGDGDIVVPLALLLCAEDPLVFVGAEAIGDGLGAGEMFVALF